MLRSNIYAETIPDIKTVASVIDPAYTGYFINSMLGIDSGRYGEHKAIRRVMCSCGHESSIIPEESKYYNEKVCPVCGGQLFNLSGGYYSSNNQFSGSVFVPRLKGNTLEIYKVEITATPKIVSGKSPKALENLKTFVLETKETLEVSLTKNVDCFTFNKVSKNAFIVILTEEIKEFFGGWVDVFKIRDSSNRIEVLPEFLIAEKAFPNVFSPELAKNNRNLFREALDLYTKNGVKSYKGTKIPRETSLEDFFDKLGFSKDIFPLSFLGRTKIKSSYNDIKLASEGEIGKIIFNRIQNGQSVYPQSIDSLIKIQLQIINKSGSIIPEPELFVSFFRDAIDHYSFDKMLDVVYKERYNWLRQNGYVPSEDTIRTRTFSSLQNSTKYSPKKPVDIIEAMNQNPLEAFKLFKAPK